MLLAESLEFVRFVSEHAVRFYEESADMVLFASSRLNCDERHAFAVFSYDGIVGNPRRKLRIGTIQNTCLIRFLLFVRY